MVEPALVVWTVRVVSVTAVICPDRLPEALGVGLSPGHHSAFTPVDAAKVEVAATNTRMMHANNTILCIQTSSRE